jgi:hypothetical protein
MGLKLLVKNQNTCKYIRFNLFLEKMIRMKKIFFLLTLAFVINGCEVENINYTTAYVYTFEAENVLTNSASIGGMVLTEGGKNVTEHGVVWSTNPNPTINDTKVALGERIGDFFYNFSGFQPGTTYYYSAYAINEIGVGYGQVESFTTNEPPPCSPTLNNLVNYGSGQYSVSSVNVLYPSPSPGDGNIELVTNSNSSAARIEIEFNEFNADYPQTGVYTAIGSEIFPQSGGISSGKARLKIINFGTGGPQGSTAQSGAKFYVENNGTVITVIFCNMQVGNNILNGKFSKSLN